MGATKSMFTDLRGLMALCECQDEMRRKEIRRSKAFRINEAIKEYNLKQSKDVRNKDK